MDYHTRTQFKPSPSLLLGHWSKRKASEPKCRKHCLNHQSIIPSVDPKAPNISLSINQSFRDSLRLAFSCLRNLVWCQSFYVMFAAQAGRWDQPASPPRLPTSQLDPQNLQQKEEEVDTLHGHHRSGWPAGRTFASCYGRAGGRVQTHSCVCVCVDNPIVFKNGVDLFG